MATPFYAGSSVNVQPDPSQFQFHLPTKCDQSCHNTFGSYKCSCVSGYQLAADGKSCLGKNVFCLEIVWRYNHCVTMDFCREKKNKCNNLTDVYATEMIDCRVFDVQLTYKLLFNTCCSILFDSSQSIEPFPSQAMQISHTVLDTILRGAYK